MEYTEGNLKSIETTRKWAFSHLLPLVMPMTQKKILFAIQQEYRDNIRLMTKIELTRLMPDLLGSISARLRDVN